ncbi:ParB/RepB/Spo0J family partition protein [Brachybacterium kimchii]|uniref:ParB/RepB/Spo0J family partition protein n=1 Tax=Brachybacterium kimchii TaxID=2942909 RepID=A0ABY4N998_9MICO|nr:ParB/RepB/Spo0J family partition protein [Brachybacterium kimchii]UQN30684.1 ParB/RepB/Spo0J family partition protein [Brachybacterium kimchii]
MEQITLVQIEKLHPHEYNPRIDAAQVEDLVASVREHGIEVPLVAAPAAGNGDEYVVLGGHRRLTAAHELGLTEVPVQIRADLTDAKTQLAFMATENLMRDQLSAVEEARLVQDMLDLGMTEAEVAKQTALGRARVKERRRLGRLAEQTGEKVHRGQISVDQALIIAEYADDEESAASLEEAAGTYNFDWAVSRAKQRREQVRIREEAERSVKATGARLVDFDTDMVGLDELISEGRWETKKLEEAAADEIGADEWTDLVIAEHRSCPGHAARLTYGNQLQYGCDQAETQHPATAAAETAEEPAPDPWDELTPEGFEAAAIHRLTWLRSHLPALDLTDWVHERTVDAVVSSAWTSYGDNTQMIGLLEGITGAEGKNAVRKALDKLPTPALTYLDVNHWNLVRDHDGMARGRNGSSYWGPASSIRKLLTLTAYDPSPVEARACELATGTTWDGDPVEAEAGEAA